MEPRTLIDDGDNLAYFLKDDHWQPAGEDAVYFDNFIKSLSHVPGTLDTISYAEFPIVWYYVGADHKLAITQPGHSLFHMRPGDIPAPIKVPGLSPDNPIVYASRGCSGVSIDGQLTHHPDRKSVV